MAVKQGENEDVNLDDGCAIFDTSRLCPPPPLLLCIHRGVTVLEFEVFSIVINKYYDKISALLSQEPYHDAHQYLSIAYPCSSIIFFFQSLYGYIGSFWYFAGSVCN